MMVQEFKNTIMVEENLGEMFWAHSNGRPNTKLQIFHSIWVTNILPSFQKSIMNPFFC